MGLRPRSVRSITKDEVREIYYRDYWLAAGCDKLRPGVDRMVYDAAVNSGVGRSRRWLMDSIGSDDDAVTVRKLYDVRMRFLRGLKIWATFGKGWKRRVDAMQAQALKDVVPYPSVATEARTTGIAVKDCHDIKIADCTINGAQPAEKPVETRTAASLSPSGQDAPAPVAPAGGLLRGISRAIKTIVFLAALAGLLWFAFGNLGGKP